MLIFLILEMHCVQLYLKKKIVVKSSFHFASPLLKILSHQEIEDSDDYTTIMSGFD